jgi:hypothetical protein
VKLLVAVKQVCAFDDEAELDAAQPWLDPDLLEWQFNDWDRFAPEAALGWWSRAEIGAGTSRPCSVSCPHARRRGVVAQAIRAGRVGRLAGLAGVQGPWAWLGASRSPVSGGGGR